MHWGFSEISSLVLIALTLATNFATVEASDKEACKVFPGDKEWPGDEVWARLNDTVHGALIKPTPLAAVCHSSWPQYDAAKCTDLYNTWGNFDMRVQDPAGVIFPYFQEFSCLPATNASTPCTVVATPEYVLNVTQTSQISAAFSFAKKHNVRLIIKNTGHDLNGKSTAAGSLSIWTFHLKNISFIPEYSDDYYTGPAMKVGAGISLETFYKAAKDNDVTVVGGECSTVGVAGGYLAGGGHSPVGGLFGMGADQVVALEAVLPNGREVKITNSTNPELFWALRGGGGSTFGVVTSVTVKAYPKIPVTVSRFSFSAGGNVSNETYWQGVRLYFDHMPAIADSGSQSFPAFTNQPAFAFRMTSFFAPNMTISQYDDLMAPFFKGLERLGIPVLDLNSTYYDNYYDGWTVAFPKIVGPYTDGRITLTGSRLIPRRNWEDPALLNRTFQAFEELSYKKFSIIMYTQRNVAPPGVNNAINPAYREALNFAIVGSRSQDNATSAQLNAVREGITNIAVPILKAISPGSGTYLNEADVREPNFQQSYFGSNYDRLLKIKLQVDPDGLLYAPTAVGSEFWYTENDGLPDVQSGRLCRKEGII